MRPGAEVVQVAASLDQTNHVTVGAENKPVRAVAVCQQRLTDARRASVSWDAAKIAFSARKSAADPFHVYLVADGKCAVERQSTRPPTTDDGQAYSSNNELVHNFDPAFAHGRAHRVRVHAR